MKNARNRGFLTQIHPQILLRRHKKRRTYWWQFGAYPKRLAELLPEYERVLVHPNVSYNLGFVFLSANTIVAAPHNVFLFSGFCDFCVLQSRVHEGWARFFSSSLKDDMRYTPTDCFGAFPFPEDYRDYDALVGAGKTYYADRANLLVRSQNGLTRTYGRFHDPHEKSSEIFNLRELHAAMDRAVLEAYGWDDLAAAARCEFLLDYEEEDDEEGGRDQGLGGRKRSKKKKPWRLRWPDDFRDEVLARLLELNEQRAAEERLAGKTAAAAQTPKKTTRRKKPGGSSRPSLPGM